MLSAYNLKIENGFLIKQGWFRKTKIKIADIKKANVIDTRNYKLSLPVVKNLPVTDSDFWGDEHFYPTELILLEDKDENKFGFSDIALLGKEELFKEIFKLNPGIEKDQTIKSILTNEDFAKSYFSRWDSAKKATIIGLIVAGIIFAILVYYIIKS